MLFLLRALFVSGKDVDRVADGTIGSGFCGDE